MGEHVLGIAYTPGFIHQVHVHCLLKHTALSLAPLLSEELHLHGEVANFTVGVLQMTQRR